MSLTPVERGVSPTATRRACYLDVDGLALDGDGDGAAGGDFTSRFTIFVVG